MEEKLMFKERLSPVTKVQAVQSIVPRIYIHTDALTKMQVFVEECSDEIGWLGSAQRQGRNIFLQDVFLFDQEVHQTTTEITPEGLMEFGERILNEPDGVDVWNSIKVWGHSHVNMAVTPSSQDNDQMKTFAESGHDWFIRLIANKKGDMKMDLYDYEHGILFEDLPWEEISTHEEDEVKRQIDELYALLDAQKSVRHKRIKEPVVAEMKEKVRKKNYTAHRSVWNQQTRQWETPSGQTNSLNGTTTPTTTVTTIDKKKEEEKETKEKKFDLINRESDVLIYFSEDELYLLGTYTTYQDFVDEIKDYGYEDFTDSDLRVIRNVAQRLLYDDAVL
jgi:uncharacterized protein YdaU (DUF1376 family)